MLTLRALSRRRTSIAIILTLAVCFLGRGLAVGDAANAAPIWYSMGVPGAAVVYARKVGSVWQITNYYRSFQPRPKPHFSLTARQYTLDENGGTLHQINPGASCGDWLASTGETRLILRRLSGQPGGEYHLSPTTYKNITDEIRMGLDYFNKIDNEWMKKGGRPAARDIRFIEMGSDVFYCEGRRR